jgi:excisionase family DNA binding protein/diguanylate cyclase (GGDEF)-like protein
VPIRAASAAVAAWKPPTTVQCRDPQLWPAARGADASHGMNAPSKSPASEPAQLAVLVVGVDRLREITDALGPPAGDQVLAATAARLGALRHGEMTLTPLFADTFALVLTGLTSREEATTFAADVLAATSAPIVVEGEELIVSVSVGVAFGTEGPVSARRVMREAATAQHRAQQRGGGCVEIFAAENSAGLLAMLRLEGELRTAVADETGLSLFFQPIISLATGAVVAVEALVRWDHPVHGLLLPSRFLPLAQRTGILPRIEQWALKAACEQLSAWELPRRMCVNVSPMALNDPGFVPAVGEHLRRYTLDPEQLIIELSEGALLAEQSATRVEELRALGVGVYLDEFGSAYAWLSQLKRLPLDGIKLSRSLVAELDESGTASVVEGVVETACALGLTVIAKDIETPQQLERVKELGVSAAQWLHFLAPVPARVLVEVLALSAPELAAQAEIEPMTSRSTAREGRGEEPAVTLGEAARLLGISASTLRRWTEDGRVSAARTSGGHRRFYVSELARLHSTNAAQLRVPALPDRALPEIADILRSDGIELARSVARSMYEDRLGWFGHEQALAPTRAWLGELASAFGDGAYEALADSLRRFMLRAEVGGAALAERYVFLDRFGPALERHLNRRDRPHSEQAAARRTIGALALEQLADDPDQHSPKRPPARARRSRGSSSPASR